MDAGCLEPALLQLPNLANSPAPIRLDRVAICEVPDRPADAGVSPVHANLIPLTVPLCSQSLLDAMAQLAGKYIAPRHLKYSEIRIPR